MKQIHTSARLFLFTVLLTSLFSSANAQTSATIDTRNYSQVNPYVISDLPDMTTYSLGVKTGKATYIKFSQTDSYSILQNPLGQSLVANELKILINLPGHWLIERIQNGNRLTVYLDVNYQADLQDQTISSATYGDYPDFIWVAQTGSATVNAGKNFGYYRWRNIDESIITLGYTDSIKTVTQGNYISETRDASGILPQGLTRDTISILEKPTFNNTTKTLNFPTTTTGITYKLRKVGFISGTDTTWTETENFVGDGNAKNITLTDGKYKLTTTFGIHSAVYPYGFFVVGVTTALDKTKEKNINYRLVDNKLQFDNEVNLKFYSLQGQLLQQGQGSSFKLCRQAGILKATDKNGNVLTAKIILQ